MGFGIAPIYAQTTAAEVNLRANTSATPVVSAHLENSVVKVFSTARGPDVFRPWTKRSASDISGSGVIIEGNRILTNAHVVGYTSQVQIQAKEGGDKINATVVAIARGIDLAVLKIDDPTFFATRAAPTRANLLPNVKDEVLVYGFPTGGSSLSITKGIVSRIEFVAYGYPTSGLRVQVDAAINPGNSGGPVFVGDKIIGLAFATGTNVQNIGYIIPTEEIELFLQDIADGKYDGKLAFFGSLQTLENPALRTFLKLDPSVRGMVVQRPIETTASYPLKEWDVITHIGTTPIDNQGMVKINNDLNVGFRYLVQKLAKNNTVPMTVIRAGKSLQVQVPLTTSRPRLIPSLDGAYPSYFIYGPLVFSKATTEFRSFLSDSTNTSALTALNAMVYGNNPLATRIGDEPTADREELVVIAAPFFAHKITSGYSSRSASVVYSINEKPVRSLKHLVSILRDLKDDSIVIKFDQRQGENIVFPRKELLESTEDILKDNGIRAQGSKDMMDVWQGK